MLRGGGQPRETRSVMMSEEVQEAGKACWTCGLRVGGDTFLGICTYFESVGKENRPIPENVVDVGCKFWEKKDAIGR